MSGRLAEMNAVGEIGRACVVECLEGVEEEFEVCTLVSGEPMEFPKVMCDVGSAWEVEGKSGCCVLVWSEVFL